MKKITRPKAVVAAVGLAALVAGPMATATAAPSNGQESAPLKYAASPNAIPGQYIVVLEDGGATAGTAKANERAVAAAADRARGQGVKVDQEYTAALRGYSAKMTPAQLRKVQQDPSVAYVEADQTVTASATQYNAPWGLDRVDQRNRPLNGTYVYDRTGSGVRVDTGVRAGHTDFGGRVVAGATAINDGRGSDDCNGHGTHVAGTAAGSTYGVAKAATIVPVRVLDCRGSGSNSGVIAGVDWVTATRSGPSVANMSLGGPISTALDAAVQRSISSGVTYAVAAGNENQNACNVSPSRVGAAITVGSTTSTDARSSFSNWGSCVDVFAPGSSITSAWHTSNTATNTINGTSMASPHVAGAAALYLQGNPGASPATVKSHIVNNATTGVLTGIGTGSPNRLLYTR